MIRIARERQAINRYKARCLFIPAILLLAAIPALGQEAEQDTVIVADTLAEPIRIHIIPSLGSIRAPDIRALVYLDLLFLEYTHAASNLEAFPGVFFHDRDAVGQPTEISAFGSGWRSIGVLIDGRVAHDPLPGVFDFNLFPPDFIEQIEYLPPWRSFLYSRNAAGGGFNLVTQSFLAPTPYTKIRHSEGGFNYSHTDIVLSQDIYPGLNMMAALQRQFFGTADAQQQFRGRFPNMNHRALNYRGKLRWNLPSIANTALVYSHTNTVTGLSGGVDIVESESDEVFNDREAIMRNTDSFQRIWRTDIALTTGLQLSPDSSDVTVVSLFYTNILRQYRDEQDRPAPNDILLLAHHRGHLYGGDVKQWLSAGPIRVQAGVNIHENYVASSTNVAGIREREFGIFSRIVLQPVPLLRTNIMIREDRIRSVHRTSFGADVSFQPSERFSITGGAIRSFRHPTMQDLYWQDSTVHRISIMLPEKHDLIFGEIGISMPNRVIAAVGASVRIVHDPIRYTPGAVSRIYPDIHIMQGGEDVLKTIYARSRFHIGSFSVGLNAEVYDIREDGNRVKRLPELDLKGDLTFRRLLFDGALDLQISLEGIHFSRYGGTEFNPETYFTSPQHIERVGPGSALNGKIVGKIGDAHVHLVYKNITGSEFMRTPFYPMLQGYFRLGITWEFLN